MMTTLEALTVFVVWMIILVQVWSASGEGVSGFTQEWKVMRARAATQALGDYLVLQSHPNPWRGCAHYSLAEKRVRVNEINESCLRRLTGENPPPETIYVGVLDNGIRKTYFERPVNVGETCWGVRRGIIVHETGEFGVLEVTSCA